MSTKKYIKYYRILSRAYFHLPLLILFIKSLGYSFNEIIFLIMIYSLTSFIFLLIKNKKVNFSNLKKQIYISEILKLVGLTCFIFFNNKFIFLILAQFFLSLSYSFSIGVDTKILNEEYFGEERRKIQAKTNAYMFLSLLISGVIGGIMYSINTLLPFVLTLIVSLIIIMITIKNNQKYIVSSTEKKEELDKSNNNKLMLYYAISRGVILTLFVAVIPFLLLQKNISPILFVIILSLYTLTGYMSSKYYSKLKLKYSDKITISLVMIFIGLILVFYNTLITIMFSLILFGLGGGLVRPITLEKIKSDYEVNQIEIKYFIVNILILVIILLY